MKRVFVDTNVILDVLLQRDGFWQDSMKIFELAELGKIKAFVSASSMTDIFFASKKMLGAAVARHAIGSLLRLFEVVGVNKEDLFGALSVDIDDYEDALQAYCATKVGADALITRDMAGFKNISIEVVSPIDFDLKAT